MGVIGTNQKMRRGRMLLGVVTPPGVEPEGEQFDPGQATVAVVLAYVEDHPDERARIRDAEQNGKARVSLLAALAE